MARRPAPTYDGTGTDFVSFGGLAEPVKLCPFEPAGAGSRVDLTEIDGKVCHCLPGVEPGQRYGHRVHGPYAASGQRFNPAKLLPDPYAKATDNSVDWGQSLFSYDLDGPASRVDDAHGT